MLYLRERCLGWRSPDSTDHPFVNRYLTLSYLTFGRERFTSWYPHASVGSPTQAILPPLSLSCLGLILCLMDSERNSGQEQS